MSTDPLAVIAEQVERLREENGRIVQRVGEAEERLRLVSRGVVRVQEAERGRISRELHDEVGQSLTALKLQVALLQQQAAGTPFAASLGALHTLADEALQEVRHICHAIRPQMLDDLGLLPTLRWLARTMEERTPVRVALEADVPPGRLGPEEETLVYRVVQEALTNAARHAGEATVRIAITVAADRVRLVIVDDGPGFDASGLLAGTDEGRGFGLRGMRDRARLAGGTFRIASAPGEGTRIEVEVPLVRTT